MDNSIKCPKCGNTKLVGWYNAFLGVAKFEYDNAIANLKDKMKTDSGTEWKLTDDLLHSWKNNKWKAEKKK